MKSRVLMVSGDRSALLPESAVLKRLIQFAEHCASLTVLICYRGPSCFQNYNGVTVIGVDISNPITGFFHVLGIGKNKLNPDIVVTQDPFFLGVIGFFLSRHYNVPLQIQVHTDVFSREYQVLSLSNRFRTFLSRLLIPHATNVRVVSRRIAESLEKRNLISKDHIFLLPLPISKHTQKDDVSVLVDDRIKTWHPKILMVARLAPEKNISLALRAFSLFYSRHSNAGLIIVGDGPLRDKLIALTKHLCIADRVLFTGQQKDVAPYYTGTDIFLSTSQYEGYGLALVEAAYAGMPIISTDAGVARELGARIVPLDIEHIAQALGESISPASVPQGLTIFSDDYAERIVEQWEAVSQHGYIYQHTTALWLTVKYLISGGTATAVNLSFLFILTDIFNIWYVYSAALAYAAAFVVSFTLQKFWTFKNGTLSYIKSQFAFYVALGIFNMALNSLLIYFVVKSTHLHYLVAQLCVGVLIALWSLMFYRVLFKNQ